MPEDPKRLRHARGVKTWSDVPSLGDYISPEDYLRKRGWSEEAIAELAREMRTPPYLRLKRKKPVHKK